jgi:hypothetical protein
MTFQGFILSSFHFELIVIQSFFGVAGSGTIVFPVVVLTDYTSSASSNSSSTIFSEPL